MEGLRPTQLAVAREKLRTRHLAYRTEQAYLQWIRRYLRFHDRRHTSGVGAEGAAQFLSHLATHRKLAPCVAGRTSPAGLQPMDAKRGRAPG